MIQKVHTRSCNGMNIRTCRLLEKVTFRNFLRVNSVEKSRIRWPWREAAHLYTIIFELLGKCFRQAKNKRLEAP